VRQQFKDPRFVAFLALVLSVLPTALIVLYFLLATATDHRSLAALAAHDALPLLGVVVGAIAATLGQFLVERFRDSQKKQNLARAAIGEFWTTRDLCSEAGESLLRLENCSGAEELHNYSTRLLLALEYLAEVVQPSIGTRDLASFLQSEELSEVRMATASLRVLARAMEGLREEMRGGDIIEIVGAHGDASEALQSQLATVSEACTAAMGALRHGLRRLDPVGEVEGDVTGSDYRRRNVLGVRQR